MARKKNKPLTTKLLSNLVALNQKLDPRLWQTTPCKPDDDCWCTVVVPVVPGKTADELANSDDWIIPSGSISKSIAEFLVTAHNSMLQVAEDE